MKSLIPKLKLLLSEQVSVQFKGDSNIPFKSFTFQKYKGKDLSFKLYKNNKLFYLDIKVPFNKSQKIVWNLNQLVKQEGNWDLVDSGKIDDLNEIQNLINKLKEQIDNYE